MDFFRYLKNELNIQLNAQQREAVQACDKRILLEACPGSGKTTTLVTRIAWQILCRKINPSGILTLTFSRASAQDMEKRFNNLFGSLVKQPVHFSTIHSFCYQFLFFCQRKRRLTVPQLIEGKVNNGKVRVLRELYVETNQEYPGDEQTDTLSNEVSFVKNKLIQPGQYQSENRNFSSIYQKYENYKKEHHLMDFDDMLATTYEILRDNRGLYQEFGCYPFVLVDEVQDTSLLQHRIIEELSRNGSLFMVGDTDQSIYGFRGAEPEYIVNIHELFPDTKILRLETNYRSTDQIVQLANQFIHQNEYRHEKNMVACNGEGEIPSAHLLKNMEDQLEKTLKLIEEAPPGKTAVLFRNNLSGMPVIWELVRRGQPFYIRENYGSFFRHFVVADTFAFFQLAYDGQDMDSFLKIYYKMGAGLSKNDMLQLKQRPGGEDILSELFSIHYQKKHMIRHLTRIRKGLKKIKHSNPGRALDIIEQELMYGDYLKRNSGCLHVWSMLKFLARGTQTLIELKMRLRTLKNGIDRYYRKKSGESVHLLTLHGSKGLEFDRVIMVDLIDGQFPSEKSLEDYNAGDRKAYEEEVRLFYVGVTRARKEVHLLTWLNGEGKKMTPSRFIQQFLALQQPEELGAGQIVHHIKFGEGIVKHCEDGVAEIQFKKWGSRKLSVEVCMASGLLWEE